MDQRSDDTARMPRIGEEGGAVAPPAADGQYADGAAGEYPAPPAGNAYGAASGAAYHASATESGYATSTYDTGSYSSASRDPRAAAPPRQARLAVARVDVWSVMKFSFMISLVCFIILFVAVAVLYGALDTLGVFSSIQRALSNVTSSQNSAGVNISSWFSASTIFGYTALLGVFDVFLITILSTVGAGIYNLVSRFVGGIEVTLREAD